MDVDIGITVKICRKPVVTGIDPSGIEALRQRIEIDNVDVSIEVGIAWTCNQQMVRVIITLGVSPCGWLGPA